MLQAIIKNIAKSIILLASAISIAQAHAPGTTSSWSYSGATGPEQWGELSKDYSLCAQGKQQSPINIARHTVATPEKDIEFHYSPAIFGRVLDGHDFSVEALSGSNEYIIFDGDRYDLQALHFHSPAEHQIDRIKYPLEVHFIHKNKQGKLLVVGVFFKEGKLNKEIQKLFAVPLPPLDTKHENELNKVTFDPRQLIPNDSGYYVYSGSLTTPPCTEGVTWLVMQKILNASNEQLEFFRNNMIDHNSRPIQPINQRVIYQHIED